MGFSGRRSGADVWSGKAATRALKAQGALKLHRRPTSPIKESSRKQTPRCQKHSSDRDGARPSPENPKSLMALGGLRR